MNITDLILSQNQPIISNGLVGYWSCNDYSGTKIKDYSTNRNDGTITGCTFVPGNKGPGLSFDGLGNTSVDCGAASVCNFTTTNFTVMFWMKPATLNTAGKDGYAVIINDGTYNANGYYIQVQGNGTGIGLITSQVSPGYQFNISNNGYLTLNIWQHIAIVRNGTVGSIYYNGAEVAGYTNRDAIVSPTASPTNLIFGKYPPLSANYWYNGVLDDIIFYNRALAVSEIETIYNGTK
jgi:hypothetical protein